MESVRRVLTSVLFSLQRCSPSRPLIPAGADLAVEEMSLNEFFNGREPKGSTPGFRGLVPAILDYLDALGCDLVTKGRLMPYLTLMQKRAAGELPTTARWIRNFVRSSQANVRSSSAVDGTAISTAVADELCRVCDEIGMGGRPCPELVGDAYIHPLKREAVIEDFLPVIRMETCTEQRGGNSSWPTSEQWSHMDELTTNGTITASSSCRTPAGSCSDDYEWIDAITKLHLDAQLSRSQCVP